MHVKVNIILGDYLDRYENEGEERKEKPVKSSSRKKLRNYLRLSSWFCAVFFKGEKIK